MSLVKNKINSPLKFMRILSHGFKTFLKKPGNLYSYNLPIFIQQISKVLFCIKYALLLFPK